MTETYSHFARSSVAAILTALVTSILITTAVSAQHSSPGNIAGTVKDERGANVSGATVSLLHSQALVQTTITDGTGNFSFNDVAPGSYEIRITQKGFDTRRAAAQVASGKTTRIELFLQVAPISSEVTIAAETGQAQDKDKIPQAVNIISETGIQQRATAVLAQIADEEPGLALQRTSPSMGEVFIRGLTGKNVPVYVDGVRYTTSTQRGGVSTFFNLNEPSSLHVVETLRGPNSAQYGSDSLGGVVALVTRTPVFGGDKSEFHGESNTFFTSSDLSFGSNLSLSYGTKHFGFYGNAAARRINTLRTANGLDSHSAVTRFLGLPSTALYGPRMPDTAFTQYGGTAHMNYALSDDQQLIFHYQRSQQDGGKRFDQLLGGDGNLIADLRNLMLDFFYGRYIKQGAGFFDTASFTFSFNSQREERRNQGGQGNPVGDITHQFERTSAYGFSFYLDKLSTNNSFLFGGDVYHERVKAPAHTLILSPGPVRDVPSRPRVPDGARHLTFGLFVQDAIEVVPEKFRLSGALRYSVSDYRSRAANSPVTPPLWPDDSLRASDFSGRIGATVRPVEGLSLVFNYSRGFRAPNITDLGTLGLTGDGFEADFASSSVLGGTIGTTANDQAVSTGIPVQKQRSEISHNVDAGLRLRRWRIETELTYFWINVSDAIVKQTLILPPGAVGRFLGSDQIIFQDPTRGWVRVAASAAPVLIRANFTDARIQGLEYYLKARLNRDWTFNGNFTYIEAKDRATGAPPNIEGGTPPPTGFLSLRYAPAGRRFWIEGYSTLADRQSRLSTLDLSDRRTGATRTLANIQNFFRRGACVHGLTTPGPTGCGSAGGILIPTGETLAQVQARVLRGAASAPLFTYLPGYGLFNVRGGFRFGERSEITLDFENITDQFYRNVSWGADGPGRSVTARYHYRF